MNRTIVARLLRVLLVACGVAVVLVVVVEGRDARPRTTGRSRCCCRSRPSRPSPWALGVVLPRIDQLVERLTHHREVTPYSALAEAAARIRAGSLEQALPGLAQVLADGTGATRAVGVARRRRPAGPRPRSTRRRWPGARPSPRPETVENLAVLLTRPDTDHVVPVLDGTVLRAALAIGKPGAPITPADQQLVQDVANGAALLLRGVALNAELAERVRRADDLADELQASRQRLARAREVERRRLVMELGARHDRSAGRAARRRGRGRSEPRRARPEDAGRRPAGAGPGPGRARRAARPASG